MARQRGSLSLSSNLEPRMASSLDARYIVEHDADLTDSNSWEYVYTGMQVYSRESQKVYILRYDNPTVSSSWVEIGTGKDGLDGKPIMVENTEKVGRENIITLVWTDIHGADHSTDVTILDGAAGPQGPEGRQGPAGQAFSLHSQYDSYEDLIAEHPTGSEGEAYFVTSQTEGAAPDVYVWLTDTNEWFNQGPITGIAGPRGADGVSPDVVVAENSEGVYKLRITTSTGSFVTPNLKGIDGNLAPQSKIDDSVNPVQSGTIKTALDAKQDKTLVSSVGVRDYTTKNIVNQTTVQAALEALAAAVNYMEIPAQLIAKVDEESDLPANAKPGSICFVGEEGDTPIVYICQEDGSWQKAGGASDDNMVEFTNNEIDNIWNGETNTSSNTNPKKTLTVPQWTSQSDFSATETWTDGDNVYYSYGDVQKKFNKDTSEWEDKSWDGLSNFNGDSIWTDGTDIYYSTNKNNKTGNNYTYVLDRNSDTWNQMSGIANEPSYLFGSKIWYNSINNKAYFYNNGINKVFDRDGLKWIDIVCLDKYNQTASISGGRIWSDGETVYYTTSLNIDGKITSYMFTGSDYNQKLVDKVWDGISSYFYGNYVWTDGTNIYYSFCDEYRTIHKILNKSTGEWEDKIWYGSAIEDGSIAFNGDQIWTDGNNIYCSNKSVLDKATSTWIMGGE